MVDIAIPSIEVVTAGAGDTVLGVKDGGVKRLTGHVLASELANSSDPAKGPALVGFDPALAYADGSIGAEAKDVHGQILPYGRAEGAFKNVYSRMRADRHNLLRKKSACGRAYIWKNPTLTGDSSYRFSVGVNMSGYKTAEWDFVSDIDGFYRMRYGYTGAIRPPVTAQDATSLSATPARSGDNAWFVSNTQLNATFQIVFTGVGLIFNHYVDNRGGRWSISIDGGAAKIVSTHVDNPENAGAVGSAMSKLIANGLSNTSHTAIFTFIGDDPAHAPSGGISRGWFKDADGVAPEAYTANIIDGSEMGRAPTGASLVANNILEFAISATPNGSGFASDWIPAHGAADGAIVVNSRAIYINNVLQDDTLSSLSAEVEIGEFTMVQSYTAYNSNDSSKTTPLWSGDLVTKFTAAEGLEFSHDITFLAETLVSEGYMSMCSGRRTEGLHRVSMDNGFSIDISGAAPGVQVNHDSGKAMSALWSGSGNALALTVPYAESSISPTLTGISVQAMLVTERTDGFVKAYYRTFAQNEVVPAGAEYSTHHKIWLATL